MVMNRYAAGNKVYNGGSSAATRGTVDPQGYVERSLRQRNSNRRSGHAAAAMRRLDRGVRRRNKRQRVLTRRIGNTKAGPRKRRLRERRLEVRLRDVKGGPRRNRLVRREQRLENRRTGNNTKPREGRRRPGNPGGAVGGPRPGQNGNRPNGGGGGNNGPNRPKKNPTPGIGHTPQYPVVKISPNGQLNLPWNMQNNMQAIQAQGAMNQGLLNLQGQEQDYMQDWTRNMRDSEIENDHLVDDTRNDFAARGLVQSSPYGQAVGQNATAWNNYETDMLSDKTNTMAQLAQQRLGIENQFNDVLQALGFDNIQDAAEQAGTLGYGRRQTGAVGTGRKPKKRGGGNKGGKSKGPKNRLSEGERRRVRRRRKLTRRIKNTKAGPRKRRLRERRLEVRLRDMEPGKAKRRVRRKEDRLEDRRKREARRQRARKRARREGTTRRQMNNAWFNDSSKSAQAARKRRNTRKRNRARNKSNASIPSLYRAANRAPNPVTPRPRNPAGNRVSRKPRRQGSRKNAFR